MKSVSFSDLRNNNGSMSNFDLNTKRSSSIKQLTYYNSSEDILKKFSSKTADKFQLKESKKPEEIHHEIEQFQNPSETILNFEEPKVESHEKTIKELREQLTQKNNIIANLQDENLELQTESNKNSEQVKYLENRIKYLEHALAAFTSNNQVKYEQSELKNDSFDKENNENNSFSNPPSSIKTKPFGSRVNFEIGTQMDERKSTNFSFSKNRYGNENIQYVEKPADMDKYDSENYQIQEKIADLKKRPTSADSALQNGYPNFYKQHDQDSSTQTRQSYTKLYDSDSEPNNSYKIFPTNSCNDNPKLSSTNFVNFQRQKLERDRSMNLSEFKSRLDEFTKYARKSTEQNTLRNSTSSLPQTSDYKSVSKYHVAPEKWNDSNSKTRVKSTNQYSRPPVDPCYKQRRNNLYETKISNEPLTNYTTPGQNEPEEDAILKERVRKILEKHNYPINNTYYSNASDNVGNNLVNNTGYRDDYGSYSYKKYGNNENQRSSEWQNRNSPIQYSVTTNVRNINNDSGVPRLDLTRIHLS